MLYFVDVSFPERYSDFRTQICRFIQIIVFTGVEWCAIVLVIALFINFFLLSFEGKFRYAMLNNCFLMYYHCTEIFEQNREFG